MTVTASYAPPAEGASPEVAHEVMSRLASQVVMMAQQAFEQTMQHVLDRNDGTAEDDEYVGDDGDGDDDDAEE
jgi:hypothetical protein